MREYAETFCPIDHASIDVKNIASIPDSLKMCLG